MQSYSKGNKQFLVTHLSRYWMVWFSLLYGIFVGLPFLAPALMNQGVELPARIIYSIYAFLCHQLPERSYFLFGQKLSYSIPEIQQVWQVTSDPMVLRQFIGTPAMGWKVAWSDRMVSMYTSILPLAWIWYPLRRKIRAAHWTVFIMLAVPMVLDGTTHMVSDLFGLHNGFRYTNEWLAALTNNAFPASFYLGDAWGSFNAWMRLITGGLFGLGVVWFGFPYLDQLFLAQSQLDAMKNQAKKQILEQSFSSLQVEPATKASPESR